MNHQLIINEEARRLKQRRKGILFLVFLLVMWFFTLLSKSVYAMALPVVSIVKPQQKYVEHIVEADGIVIRGKEQAVTSQEGLRVEEVFIRAGDKVEAGAALFRVDLQAMQETMAKLELEMARLQYSISDWNANRKLEADKKQQEEARAREDYQRTESETNRAAERAEEVLDQAEEYLDEHLESPPEHTSEADRDRAWDAYRDWTAREEELNGKVAELEILIADLEARTDMNDGDNDDDNNDSNNEEIDDTTVSGEAAVEDEAAEDEGTGEELAAARFELEELRAALAEHEKGRKLPPDFSGEDAAYEGWKGETNALQDEITLAGYSRTDAYSEQEDKLKEAQRNIEDTLDPMQVDSAVIVNELELKNLRQQNNKLQDIMKNDGIVSAPAAGTVTEVNVSVGGLIPNEAAVLLTDDSVPFRFRVTIDKEQKKYVNRGDTVLLKLNGEIGESEVKVDYLEDSKTVPGSYDLFIDLAVGDGFPGLGGTVRASAKGESYNSCIPVEALYEKNEAYCIYLLKEREGVLGNEFYAEMLSVNVVDQNEYFAAIAEGVLDEGAQVIRAATDVIERGTVVRVEESDYY